MRQGGPIAILLQKEGCFVLLAERIQLTAHALQLLGELLPLALRFPLSYRHLVPGLGSLCTGGVALFLCLGQP